MPQNFDLRPRLDPADKPTEPVPIDIDVVVAVSTTMDLHKCYYQSLTGSLILFRDALATRKLFADGSDYLDFEAEIYMFFHLAPVLRCCIMNHATRATHIDGLFDSVLGIGRELVESAPGQ